VRHGVRKLVLGGCLLTGPFPGVQLLRPDKPLEFMADYFSNALQGRTAVARSYRYIRLTRRNRQAFLDNLAAAYACMARQGESKGGGLTGADYMQLIKLLCQDFPNDIVASLTQVLDKKETDIISFPVFVAGVNACLIYEEFFEHAEHIFNACDIEGKGLVDQEVFFSILRQMNQTTADVDHATEGWTIPSFQLIDTASAILQQDGVSTTAKITYKQFILTVIKVFISRGEAQAVGRSQG
jgi:Ca2+-binding EF-hand superfamily protein